MEKLEMPPWVKIKEPELKKIIAKLSEKHSTSQIGFILRDQYGIPTVRIFGKSLKEYLEEQDLYENEDLKNAEKKVEKLKEHLKENITDRKAKHKLQKAQSRLNITQKYFGVEKKKKK